MIDWRAALGLKPREVADGSPDEAYRVFTRAFDVELTATDIPGKLRTISPDRREWRDEKGTAWQAAQDRANCFAIDQAVIDSAVRSTVGFGRDFAVTFLVDQSGSMKGEPISAVAASVAAIESALAAAGTTTEILGFSTAGWRGGFAREKWLRSGRPSRPGRLCALLHIAYKSADEAEWSEQSKIAMLHPDLLRENVDGEALDWAVARISGLPHANKLLIILSDGAPVDDSTLSENGPSYLERDIRRAIAEIEDDGAITLGALGIGYDVDRYYQHARKGKIESLPTDLAQLLDDLVTLRRQAAP